MKQTADINVILRKLKFPLTKTWQGNTNPLIFACKYGPSSVPITKNCSYMSATYSTQSLVSTFNNILFWDMFKNRSSNQQHFFSEIHELGNKVDTLVPRKSEFGGPGYDLTLFVRHNYGGAAGLVLHDPATLADMRSNNEMLDLEGGKIYDIRVTPQRLSIDDGVKQLSPARRKCRLPGENNSLNIFKWYTQSSCLFECQLKRAYKACGCIGWEYPHFAEDLRVCYGLLDKNIHGGMSCFESYMDSGGTPRQCPECLLSCEGISYPYTIKSKDFLHNWYAFCNENAAELGIPDFVPNQMMTR